MANIINWFEIPAKDFDRAVKFYSTILGITMEKTNMMGFDMGFFPGQQGEVSGAVVAGEGYVPGDKGTLVYLNGGDDLNNVLSKVESAGGKVAVPKTKITDEIGYFAIFMDPEGNKVALHSQK
jgi:predicted enzyme related to lactoylglutathione lyase